MASEGNWATTNKHMEQPAPADDVVRFLGEANRNVPVAVGVLKNFAGMSVPAWPKDKAGWDMMSSINADVLTEGGSGVTILPIVPVDRIVTEPVELNDGIYAANTD